MSVTRGLLAIASAAGMMAVTGVVAGCSATTGGSRTAQARAVRARRAAAPVPSPPSRLAAHRLRARPHTVARGTKVSSAAVFTDRVFANAHDGFALANDGNAQYPVRSTDAGRSWRIDGPQFHVDAADGGEGVGYVGVAGPRMFFAYGSSVVDVTANAGRTWWETDVGELVMAVVPGPRGELVAFVQQSVSNNHVNPAVIWQYVSADGGRHWRYSTALGGLALNQSHHHTAGPGGGGSREPIERCAAADLRLRRGRHSGAGLGSVEGYVSLTNTSHSTCRLTGWPQLATVTVSGKSAIARRVPAGSLGLNITGVPVVTLRPGQYADVAFGAGDNPVHGSTCPPPWRWLRVSPPSPPHRVRGTMLSAWIAYYDHYLPACTQVVVSDVVPQSAVAAMFVGGNG